MPQPFRQGLSTKVGPGYGMLEVGTGEKAKAPTGGIRSEEIGDLLFAVVNLARRRKIRSEDALRDTVNKFIRRFHGVEARAAEAGRDPAQCGLAQLDRWWEEVKAEERGEA